MLELKNVSYSVGDKDILKNIDLEISDRFVAITGPNGSGKSTLLNLLGGLDSYNSGEIIIKGVSSKDFKQSHFDSYRNTYVGFIFQEYNILENFSVEKQIAETKSALDVLLNS